MTKGNEYLLEISMNQIMILSMPNSGSDWLAESICESQDDRKYFREFFNPATNNLYCDILLNEFGCEYTKMNKNIIAFNDKRAEDIYNKTWKNECYNLAKENYSFSKMSFYKKHFNCFVFVRDVKNSLPAKRNVEVNGWYLAIYYSLLENKNILPFLFQNKIDDFTKRETRLIEKVVFSYSIYNQYIIYLAIKNSIPIVRYEDIISCNESDLNEILFSLKTDLNVYNWSKYILSTRKKINHKFNILNCDWIISNYFSCKFL